MNEPTPEENKNRESMETVITKEAVIKSLEQNPEDVEILRTYIDNKMRQIQAPYVSREDTEKLTFQSNLELAEIYRDAGLIEAAADAYNDAADMAQTNGMEEEYEKILAELAKI
jgi:hypothetical protein